jgi:hypothetical protein
MSKATGDLLGHFEAREVEGCASADSSPHKKRAVASFTASPTDT